jgi:hypothetical protein
MKTKLKFTAILLAVAMLVGISQKSNAYSQDQGIPLTAELVIPAIPLNDLEEGLPKPELSPEDDMQLALMFIDLIKHFASELDLIIDTHSSIDIADPYLHNNAALINLPHNHSSIWEYHNNLLVSQQDAITAKKPLTKEQIKAVCDTIVDLKVTGFECDNMSNFEEEMLLLEGLDCKDYQKDSGLRMRTVTRIWRERYSEIWCEPKENGKTSFPEGHLMGRALLGTWPIFII